MECPSCGFIHKSAERIFCNHGGCSHQFRPRTSKEVEDANLPGKITHLVVDKEGRVLEMKRALPQGN